MKACETLGSIPTLVRAIVAVLSIAVLITCSASAEPAEKTETFDADPKWDALNNRRAVPKSVTQDFGYSQTSNASNKSAPGEIGGLITIAAEPAYYAKTIEPKTLDDALTASGNLVVKTGVANALICFFNSDTLNEWRTPNTVALRIMGRGEMFFAFSEYATNKWRATGGGFAHAAPDPATGKAPRDEFLSGPTIHPWTLQYDPNGNNGGGTVTITLDNRTSVLNLLPGHKLDGATFNRFGLLNQMKHASDAGEIWISDLTINGEKQELTKEPAGWAGHQNRRTYETLDVRPNGDFGFSPTHNAKGKAAGELGGLIHRGDIRLPDGVAYYADRLEPLGLEKSLKASGTISYRRGVTDSTTIIGFFNVPESTTIDPSYPKAPKSFNGYIPHHFFGMAIKGMARDGFFLFPIYRITGEIWGGHPNHPQEAWPHIYPDGSAHDWSLEYSPDGAGGKGQVKITLGDHSATLDLADGHKTAGAQFNRFGIITLWIDGNGQVVYLDDLTYTIRQ